MTFTELTTPLNPQHTSYFAFVRDQSQRNPCLQNLAYFLARNESPCSCRIASLEFYNTTSCPLRQRSFDQFELESLLENKSHEANLQGRLLIIEDISRELIEALGSSLRIDPFFFASHIDIPEPDITTTRPYISTLPSRSKNQNFVNLHYQRVIQFECEVKHRSLYRKMNITRKVVLLKTKGVVLGLARHCCSVLQTVGRDGLWLGIILVDPIDASYITEARNYETTAQLPSRPFLGGFEDFVPRTPDDGKLESNINRSSLFESLLSYWQNEFPKAFNTDNPTLASLSIFPLKIVAGEFMTYLEVMYHSTKQYEYSPKNTMLEQISCLSADLTSLQQWTRRSMATSDKINLILGFLRYRNSKDDNSEEVTFLIDDFEYIATNLERYSRRIEEMLPIVAAMLQITDARRSFMETANITRLTYLALIFVPLSFTCGLFSMNDNLISGRGLFGAYFAVAIPICTTTFLIARPPTKLLVLVVKWLQMCNVVKRRPSKDVSELLELSGV